MLSDLNHLYLEAPNDTNANNSYVGCGPEMRLQFFVVETGERWRRALVRMVLDAKTGTNHNDYGSIGGGSEAQVVVDSALSKESKRAAVDTRMTQNDLYQRQPLLPQEPWPGKSNGGGGGGTSTTDFYIDVDEELTDELMSHHGAGGGALNGGGTVIAIDTPRPHRDERFPKEKWKTVLALLFLGVNFIFTTVSLALTHERVPDKDKYPPLPDAILDNVPYNPSALDVSEILIMIMTNITALVIICHKHRWIVLRRVFLIVGVLYMMRSVTMYVTVLPVSDTAYYCSPKMNSTSTAIIAGRAFQLLSGFGLSINGKHTYCGDFIYSGHTVILVICYLIISEYSPKKLYALHWMAGLAAVAGITCILISRGHYTIDILIAYYATTTLFWMYHTLANHKKLKQATSDNSLSRIWWFRPFLFFEGNVMGPVPRHYNWPLPWPRRFFSLKHPNRDS